MKTYRRHNCQGRHAIWQDLAACVWPHGVVDGDGPFAAVSCGAHAVTLYASADQAQARKRSLDRDGCRPGCRRRHDVVLLDPAPQQPARTAVARQGCAPARTPPRPNVRCRRPEPGTVVPEPGTVVRTTGGHALVYVGDRADLVDVEALAPQLREARSVELVGDVWQAARPIKQLLGEAWTAATRAAREASRPPAVPKPPVQRCGRPRTNGQPCRAFAGTGSDTPGIGPCARHGGSTAQKEAEAERVANQALKLAQLTVKARTTPLTPQERLEGLTAMRDVLAAQKTRRRRYHAA